MHPYFQLFYIFVSIKNNLTQNETTMKKILLLLCLFALFTNTKAQDSTSYELEFSDGYKDVVTFNYTGIDSCFKHYFSFEFINLGLFFGNEEPLPLGTFITNFDYHFYPGDNNQYFYGNLYIPILDGARMEPESDEYKTVRVYIDGGFSQAFYSKSKVKDKKLNFYNPDRQVAGYDYTLHTAKLPVHYQSKWMYRGGIGLHQRGISRYAENNTIEIDDIRYSAASERSMILQLGISRSKYTQMNYTSQGFGSQKAAIINHMYFDLLAAPFIKLEGEAHNSEGQIVETGALDQLNELTRNMFGWRFGIKYQGSTVKATSRGTTAGIEFGNIPGLANGGGYCLFKYGMLFYWN